MALPMTRPWKHPDSGYYWFRKRVPDDLRKLVRKSEERFTLGTRDPIEAKRLHALKLTEVEERWANLRAGQRPLLPDEVAKHAAAIGDQLRRHLEADPYQPLRWDVEIGAGLWSAGKGEVYTDITQPLGPSDRKRSDQQNICYGLVDQQLSEKGLAFAAEAGSLKNVNSERVVPVHSALMDEGFLKFVASTRKGPLFPDLKPDRFDSRGGTGTKILSKWIRSLGVVDKRISPNHSWRHRVKTLGRRNDLALVSVRRVLESYESSVIQEW
jgi:hypothetical protein